MWENFILFVFKIVKAEMIVVTEIIFCVTWKNSQSKTNSRVEKEKKIRL